MGQEIWVYFNSDKLKEKRINLQLNQPFAKKGNSLGTSHRDRLPFLLFQSCSGNVFSFVSFNLLDFLHHQNKTQQVCRISRIIINLRGLDIVPGHCAELAQDELGPCTVASSSTSSDQDLLSWHSEKSWGHSFFSGASLQFRNPKKRPGSENSWACRKICPAGKAIQVKLMGKLLQLRRFWF